MDKSGGGPIPVFVSDLSHVTIIIAPRTFPRVILSI